MKNRGNSEQIFCLMPGKTPKFSELISDLKPNLAKIFPNPVLTSNRIIQGPSVSLSYFKLRFTSPSTRYRLIILVRGNGHESRVIHVWVWSMFCRVWVCSAEYECGRPSVALGVVTPGECDSVVSFIYSNQNSALIIRMKLGYGQRITGYIQECV